ncbi:hypothetical protein ACX27O_27845 [Micromonospora sp. SD19]|uniref:PH domain-containing protein n=1 Tax=Micromonospora parva TaxID=1464048 RepID=A0ABW6VZI2_9ACTN|nr:hypothetical protein [Micromonospora sp. C97]MBQ1030756.1 hypothetical protein [Micromonospora sp. C97]
MKVRQPYFDRLVLLLFGMLLLTGAVGIAYAMLDVAWVGLFLSAAAVAFGLATGGRLVRDAVLPFRVDVDPQGLSVRTSKLNRQLRWDEVDAVVLADPPATAGRHLLRGPRLLLVPAAGVSLGVPLPEKSPVDGRPAIELFELAEVAYDEDEFTRDLAVLAGERFQQLSRQLVPPADGVPLRRFPDQPERARLNRWLDRRRAVLFVGWYLVVLVPALVLVVVATQRNELLGAIVLVVSLVVVGIVTTVVRRLTESCRDLIDTEAMIDGADLVIGSAPASPRISLLSGIVTVLRPGQLNGFGDAWLLARSTDEEPLVPLLLLGDPRTGLLRDRDDLRALEAVLRRSADERDRAAGRQLDELAARAPSSPTVPPAGARPARAHATALWQASKGVGRAVVLLGVVVTVVIAGGWVVEEAAFVGPALIVTAVGMLGVWIVYAVYRVLVFGAALLTIVARVFR